MTVESILLDCDPGCDDAAAIMLAAGSPRIRLLGITTVAGNQLIDTVTSNALRVIELAGIRDVPVAKGSPRPLIRPAVVPATEIHGESGLGVEGLREADIELDPRPAAQFIVDTIMREPAGTVTLVPTGPLTNIALAARLEPRIVDRVRRVVLMGGACRTGNVGPSMEFNIENDPEAAHIVFNAGWEVVMVGLDLTYQARAEAEIREAFGKLGTRAGHFMHEVLEAFAVNYRAWRGFDSPPLHDPCAVAWVIDPTLMETVAVPIDVEIRGALTAGTTVADFRRPAPEGCRTFAAMKLDVDRFWALMLESVKNLG